MHEIYTSMGMFGARSPKPTKLISDDGWISHVQRTGSFPTRVDFLEIYYIYRIMYICIYIYINRLYVKCSYLSVSWQYILFDRITPP